MHRKRTATFVAACVAVLGLAVAPAAHSSPSTPAPSAAVSPASELDPQNSQKRAQEMEAAGRAAGLPARKQSPPISQPIPQAKARETCDQALDKLRASKGRYKYGSCFEPMTEAIRPRGLEPAPWPGVPSWCKKGTTTQLHRQDACTYPNEWAFRVFDTRGEILGTGVVEIFAQEVATTRSLNLSRTVNVRVLSAIGVTTAGALTSWGNCYGQYCKLTTTPVDNRVPFTQGASYKDFRVAAVDPLPGQPFWTYWVGGLEFRGAPGVEIQPAKVDFPYSSRIRCDRNAVGNNTDGCVFPDYWPTFSQELSRTDPVVGVSEAAQHILDAQSYLTANHWGKQGVGKPLSRTQNDDIADDNRKAACPASRPPGPEGTSCDEYPFAHTYEGAAYQGKGDNSVRDINAKHNSNSGNELGIFFGSYRMVDRDYFWVRIDP